MHRTRPRPADHPGPANVQRLFELSGMNEILPFCDPELAGDAPPSDDPQI